MYIYFNSCQGYKEIILANTSAQPMCSNSNSNSNSIIWNRKPDCTNMICYIHLISGKCGQLSTTMEKKKEKSAFWLLLKVEVCNSDTKCLEMVLWPTFKTLERAVTPRPLLGFVTSDCSSVAPGNLAAETLLTWCLVARWWVEHQYWLGDW